MYEPLAPAILDTFLADDSATRLVVNGAEVVLALDPQTPLLFALRNDLGLRGVRCGCGIGECGACTVICDARAIRSCITPLAEVDGASITTPEGLGGPDRPHPIQRAFLDEQAAQCGYCINGIVMSAAAALQGADALDESALQQALSGHLCRCGTHDRILRACWRAAGASQNRPAAHQDLTDELSGGTEFAMGDDGGPCVGVGAPGQDAPPGIVAAPRVEAWLRLGDSGRIEARSGKVEFGQGIRTALAQIVAAELGIPVSGIVFAPTSTADAPDEGYTAGSASLEHGGRALAIAAAAFRRLLLERAARWLGGSPGNLLLNSVGVIRTGSGACVSYAELASEGPVTGMIESGDRPRVGGAPLGESIPREDLRAKLTGAPAYVHDISLPDMLHARALLPPSYAAVLEDVDLEAARTAPGVHSVVREGRAILALAEREEQAIAAVARLARSARWSDPGLPLDGGAAAALRRLPAEPHIARSDDGVDAALTAGRVLRASYGKPYESHGSMAPSCAVALADDDGLAVWTHSQGIYPLRRELAVLVGEDEARLTIHHGDGPGCYGMNGADDAAAFAALGARACRRRPVRFQFSVEQEFAWEPYGPAMTADLEAGLDAEGRIAAWRHRTRTDVHGGRPDGAGHWLAPAWLRQEATSRPWPGPAESGARNMLSLYEVPVVEAIADHVRGPLRTGPLRSLGGYFNVFAVESFIDELAEAASEDPVAFRLAHLRDERARAVLAAAAETAGWTARVGPSGGGQGVALARYKGTKAYVAEVIDAEVDPEAGEIHVRRIVIACDAGTVVNPDGLRNQLEGGALQGISRALHEEVHADERGVRSRDWATYPVLRFAEVPRLEVVVLARRGYPSLGVGEAATPPAPAALANAVDDAIGIRLRTLPLTPKRLQHRLLEMSEAEAARVLLS